jgi:hypothetical protein
MLSIIQSFDVFLIYNETDWNVERRSEIVFYFNEIEIDVFIFYLAYDLEKSEL